MDHSSHVYAYKDADKYYLRSVKGYQSRFLENGWSNTYFEAIIVIYDQSWV